MRSHSNSFHLLMEGSPVMTIRKKLKLWITKLLSSSYKFINRSQNRKSGLPALFQPCCAGPAASWAPLSTACTSCDQLGDCNTPPKQLQDKTRRTSTTSVLSWNNHKITSRRISADCTDCWKASVKKQPGPGHRNITSVRVSLTAEVQEMQMGYGWDKHHTECLQSTHRGLLSTLTEVTELNIVWKPSAKLPL